eukprot:14532-Heterococcus_DN1.PRE.2
MSRRSCRACACETAHQHHCEQLHSQCYDDKRTVQQHARAVAQCAAVGVTKELCINASTTEGCLHVHAQQPFAATSATALQPTSNDNRTYQLNYVALKSTLLY